VVSERNFIEIEEMNANTFYVIAIFVVALVFVSLSRNSKNTFEPVTVSSNLVQLTNAERVKNGLNILTENARLNIVAYNFALEMNKFQFQNHVSPTGLGPPERVRNGGVSFSGVGENLAWGPQSDSAAIQAWMASEGHRNNILDPRWKQIGVGVLSGKILAWGDYEVKYYVQVFIF
jgi:uncharacterized protein YkwD